MSCKYCRSEEFLTDTRSGYRGSKCIASPGIRVDIIKSALGIEAVGDTYEPNYQKTHIAINFCPMCGEQLRERFDIYGKV